MIGLTITVKGDGPGKFFRRARDEMARAVSIAVAGATEGAKEELRRQLDARGGRMVRLKGAIRSQVYPRPPRFSARAAGAIYASGDDTDRMFAAFSTGPVITPKGKALAIPVHNYRDINGRLLGPRSSFFARRAVFIPRSRLRVRSNQMIGVLAMRVGGRASSIRRQRNAARRRALSQQLDADLVPVFLLVASVRMPKLLSPERIIPAWTARIPDLIQAALKGID